MVKLKDSEQLRRSALEHLWIRNADWVRMAEEGGPTIVVEGKGVRITDAEGKSWIDCTGGYHSISVGYGRTEIAEAMRQQMRRIHYFPTGTTTQPLIRLVEKLGQLAPGSLERTIPTTGGSEANEHAIKVVRSYHKRRGEGGRYKIISRKGSYHGATGGVMWLGRYLDCSDYEPGPPGMIYAPQPNPYRCELGGRTPSDCAVRCAQAVEDLIKFHGPKTVAAVIAEPVAQPPGAVVPGPEYWPMLRQICDKYGVLLIDDEVICGFGRTGKMFGVEHWGVVPDVMTVAKGITSSYLPMSAAIFTREVADAFAGEESMFVGALTFGGHPVTAAAALKNIEILERENLVQNSARMGAYFLEQLRGIKEEHPIVGDARGLGLLLALELVSNRETKAGFPPEAKLEERLTEKFRNQGLVLRADKRIVSFGPPLCITRSEIDEIIRGVGLALGEMEKELSMAR